MLRVPDWPPHDRRSLSTQCSDCPSIPWLTSTLRKFWGASPSKFGGGQSGDIFREGGAVKKITLYICYCSGPRPEFRTTVEMCSLHEPWSFLSTTLGCPPLLPIVPILLKSLQQLFPLLTQHNNLESLIIATIAIVESWRAGAWGVTQYQNRYLAHFSNTSLILNSEPQKCSRQISSRAGELPRVLNSPLLSP